MTMDIEHNLKRAGDKIAAPKRGLLFTYSGRISYPDGAPSIQDIAVGLSRECRYAGAGLRWWPVALHCFCVADLMPKKLKVYGLLHDASECLTGDVPKPVKTDEIEQFEEEMQERIYKSLGLPLLTSEKDRAIVKQADRDVLRGEVYTVGTQALQEVYERCPHAERIVVKYLKQYPPMECISPDGSCPIEFIRRFRIYKDLL